MKTRSPETAQQSGLPPPPAPTARDANPWPMTAPPEAKQHASQPRVPGRKGGSRSPDKTVAHRERRSHWIPLAILVFVAGAGVQQAIKAIGEGDVETAIVALVFVAMAAFVLMRRVKRKK